MMETPLTVKIQQIRLESADIASFDFVAVSNTNLPCFSAGAHINVQLPGGPSRSYSLVSAPSQSSYYRIAVKREPDSRGGSVWFHETARVGMMLNVSQPVNDFELMEKSPLSTFVSGGIGITPMLSMIERLNRLGLPWQVHYSARTPDQMAFVSELEKFALLGDGKVKLYFTAGECGRMDIGAIVRAAPAGSHLYCCGPKGMIDAFVTAAKDRSKDTVHYERFSASKEAASAGGFELHLARDGRILPVTPGRSILDVLLDAGVNVQYACTEGVCGTCKINVLDGIPDHRDDCLTSDEKDANNAIITCCSGSISRTLTLDL